MTENNSTAQAFYTYAHYRADQPERGPFYIGKGKGPRAWKVNGRSEWWRKTAEKHGVAIEILSHWPTEEDAYSHERLLIDCMRGMRLKIVNLTAGGDGLRDIDGSIRRRIGQKVSAAWSDPKMRHKFMAQHSDKELVAKKSERLKATFATPESKKKRSDACRAAHARPEVRAKSLKNASDPAIRAKISEGVKSASASTEAKAKRGAASKRMWQDPDHVANFRALMRANSEAKRATMPPEKAEKNRRWVENADRRKANGSMTKREAGNIAGQQNRARAEARRALLPPEERARLEKQAADRLFYKNRKRSQNTSGLSEGSTTG